MPFVLPVADSTPPATAQSEKLGEVFRKQELVAHGQSAATIGAGHCIDSLNAAAFPFTSGHRTFCVPIRCGSRIAERHLGSVSEVSASTEGAAALSDGQERDRHAPTQAASTASQ
jgi:hypothetical protein